MGRELSGTIFLASLQVPWDSILQGISQLCSKKKYSDVIREPAYFPSTLPLRETSVVVRGIVDKNYDGLSSQPHVNIKGPGRQALWMKVEHQKKDKG